MSADDRDPLFSVALPEGARARRSAPSLPAAPCVAVRGTRQRGRAHSPAAAAACGEAEAAGSRVPPVCEAPSSRRGAPCK